MRKVSLKKIGIDFGSKARFSPPTFTRLFERAPSSSNTGPESTAFPVNCCLLSRAWQVSGGVPYLLVVAVMVGCRCRWRLGDWWQVAPVG